MTSAGMRSVRSASSWSRGFRSLTVLLASVLACAGAAAAQVSLDPADVQVNTHTAADQVRPAVAADAHGNFVVVWDTSAPDGSDQSGTSIRGRRYRADGTPLSAEFQVNTYTTGDQIAPRVAMDAQGNFVVAWQSHGSAGTDQAGWSIQARRFAASGAPLTDDFQVNTYTSDGYTGDQVQPRVAMDPAGDFVVVWRSDHVPFAPGIHGQLYSWNGGSVGGEFQADLTTAGGEGLDPDVAMDGSGWFVVAWGGKQPGITDSDEAILARRYTNTGAAVGGFFQVNTVTTGYQQVPAVGADAAGDFVIAWTSGNEKDIGAQRYQSDGSPLGGEFQVNSYTAGAQYLGGVGMAPDGTFVVTWYTQGAPGDPTWSVAADQMKLDGTNVTGEFQVNTYTSNDQMQPAIGVDGGGNFVMAWSSYGSFGDDDLGNSIQMRRFYGLFGDGFESGALGWSASSGGP